MSGESQKNLLDRIRTEFETEIKTSLGKNKIYTMISNGPGDLQLCISEGVFAFVNFDPDNMEILQHVIGHIDRIGIEKYPQLAEVFKILCGSSLDPEDYKKHWLNGPQLQALKRFLNSESICKYLEQNNQPNLPSKLSKISYISKLSNCYPLDLTASQEAELLFLWQKNTTKASTPKFLQWHIEFLDAESLDMVLKLAVLEPYRPTPHAAKSKKLPPRCLADFDTITAEFASSISSAPITSRPCQKARDPSESRPEPHSQSRRISVFFPFGSSMASIPEAASRKTSIESSDSDSSHVSSESNLSIA